MRLETKEQRDRFEKQIERLCESEQFGEAYQKIQQFMPYNDQNISFLKLAGMCYLKGENYAKAEMLFMQGLHLLPDDQRCIEGLSYALLKQGYLEGAAPYIEKLKHKDSVLIDVIRAEYYNQQHDTNRAIEYAKKAYNQAPDTIEIELLLCSVLATRLEHWQEVVERLEKIKKVKDTNKVDELMMMTLYKAGQYDQCKKYCKKVIMLKPQSEATQKAKELVKRMKKIEQKTKESSNKTVTVSPVQLEEALHELNALIGLESVKEQINKLHKKVAYNKYRQEVLDIKEETSEGYHFIFIGNPGTGKTTVARLIGSILHGLGILEKGHLIETDRAGIVGQFIGQTAQLTTQKIEEAMGGVLFIDEAYALSRKGQSANDFGQEAIDILIKAVEDKRSAFVVILAGYKEEMRELLKANPGIASRFNKVITFEDYTDQELLEMAMKMAAKKHYYMSEEAKKAFLQRIDQERIDEKFGNGRTARNIMEEAFEEKANRFDLTAKHQMDIELLEAIDFGVKTDESMEFKAQLYLGQLHQMIGLNQVKQKVDQIIKYLQYQKENEVLGYTYKPPYIHMVFAGNPGTGKTTIALLISQIFKAIGILKKGHLVSVTRNDLVGQHIGETGPKTLEKIKEAYGGILFIDEAYSLVQKGANDFGKEAVDTLIKEMEDHRDKLVVILAGYTQDMDELIQTNLGFKSRISDTILFEDYTPQEMFLIFESLCQKEDYTMEQDFVIQLEQQLESLYAKRSKDFGNAREVRKVFEQVCLNLAIRVQTNGIQGAARRLIKGEDLH